MGAYEIEYLFKTFENLDDAVYRPENFTILKYCYENYKFNSDIDAFIEEVSVVQEETNIMHYFNNPEKTPFNYVMGDTLDQLNTLGIIA